MYTDLAAILIGIFAIVFSVVAGLTTARAVIALYAANLERRIYLVDRKLDTLLDQLGIEHEVRFPDDLSSAEQSGVARIVTPLSSTGQESVENYLRQGQIINAIRVYREQTGAGLKESKDAVESMARQMGVGDSRWR